MRKGDFCLLNSEGCLLYSKRHNEYVTKNSEEEICHHVFVIYDMEDGIVDILDSDKMKEFIHGDLELHGQLKSYKYSEFPGSMKPDLRSLDEFIGIDTTGKIY
jgi:hypothetical protein